MIDSCPLCNNDCCSVVWQVSKSPLLLLIEPHSDVTVEHFAPLEVVQCIHCGHIYNRSFDERLWDRMYLTDIITNFPVHPSMSLYLQSVVDWIGLGNIVGADVLEIGSGSGHLARIISQFARSVTVFEPSVGLTKTMLPEKNIHLINQPFSAASLYQKFDLIVCRQVLEHVAQPQAMIAEMKKVVKETGLLYLEVPSVEFIIKHGAFFDFHLAHVQYYCRDAIERLAQKAELVVIRQRYVKNEHDLCSMLKFREPDRGPNVTVESKPIVNPEVFEKKVAFLESSLNSANSPCALFGATWQTVGLISVIDFRNKVKSIFDDNSSYWGKIMYGVDQTIPIMEVKKDQLQKIESVFVAAYLHQEVITDRLRHLGFEGAIISICI